jgi:hypothetical protein
VQLAWTSYVQIPVRLLYVDVPGVESGLSVRDVVTFVRGSRRSTDRLLLETRAKKRPQPTIPVKRRRRG